MTVFPLHPADSSNRVQSSSLSLTCLDIGDALSEASLMQGRRGVENSSPSTEVEVKQEGRR